MTESENSPNKTTIDNLKDFAKSALEGAITKIERKFNQAQEDSYLDPKSEEFYEFGLTNNKAYPGVQLKDALKKDNITSITSLEVMNVLSKFFIRSKLEEERFINKKEERSFSKESKKSNNSDSFPLYNTPTKEGSVEDYWYLMLNLVKDEYTDSESENPALILNYREKNILLWLCLVKHPRIYHLNGENKRSGTFSAFNLSMNNIKDIIDVTGKYFEAIGEDNLEKYNQILSNFHKNDPSGQALFRIQKENQLKEAQEKAEQLKSKLHSAEQELKKAEVDFSISDKSNISYLQKKKSDFISLKDEYDQANKKFLSLSSQLIETESELKAIIKSLEEKLADANLFEKKALEAKALEVSQVEALAAKANKRAEEAEVVLESIRSQLTLAQAEKEDLKNKDAKTQEDLTKALTKALTKVQEEAEAKEKALAKEQETLIQARAEKEAALKASETKAQEEAKEKAQALTQAAEAAKAQAAQAEADLEATKVQLTQVEKEALEAKEALALALAQEALAQVEALTQAAEEPLARAEINDEKNESLQVELESKKEELAKVRVDLAKAQAQAEKAEAEAAEAKAEAEALTQARQDLIATLKQHKEYLELLNTQKELENGPETQIDEGQEELAKDLQDALGKIDELEQTKESLERNLKSLITKSAAEAKAKAQAQAAQAQAQAKEALAKVAEANKKARVAEEKAKAAEAQALELDQAATQAREALAEKEAQLVAALTQHQKDMDLAAKKAAEKAALEAKIEHVQAQLKLSETCLIKETEALKAANENLKQELLRYQSEFDTSQKAEAAEEDLARAETNDEKNESLQVELESKKEELAKVTVDLSQAQEALAKAKAQAEKAEAEAEAAEAKAKTQAEKAEAEAAEAKAEALVQALKDEFKKESESKDIEIAYLNAKVKELEMVLAAKKDETESKDQQNSAIKIQSLVRGYIARKNLLKKDAQTDLLKKDVYTQTDPLKKDVSTQTEEETPKKTLESDKPLTVEEIIKKIDKIKDNDQFNLSEKQSQQHPGKTKFFNTNKVMRTLAKVRAIEERSRKKTEGNLGEWEESWKTDNRKSQFYLTNADKAILVMLGMKDGGIEKVFKTDPANPKFRFNFKKIDKGNIKNIMDVAFELIYKIERGELTKYEGKEFKASKSGELYKIDEKLDEEVSNRRLTYKKIDQDKIAPATSVEKAGAVRLKDYNLILSK